MDLQVKFLKNLDNHWILVRVDGSYDQHAHFAKKKEAEELRRCLEAGKLPDKKSQLVAAKRLLSEEEYRSLNKKDRYVNKPRSLRFA